MRLYFISLTIPIGVYSDEYDSAVVSAENQEEATKLAREALNWADNLKLSVVEIGSSLVDKGIVLASYNAA